MCFQGESPSFDAQLSTTSTGQYASSSGTTEHSFESSNSSMLGILYPPAVNIEAGTYYTPLTLEITHPDPSVLIYYTLDGSTPDPSTSLLYSTSIQITESATVKACAVKLNWENSSVLIVSYEIELPVPIIDTPSSKFNEEQAIHLSTSFPEAQIYYTLDGTIPTVDHGILYSDSIVIDGDYQLKAITYKSGCTSSEIVSVAYEVGEIIQSVSPASGSMRVSLDTSIQITFHDTLATDVIGQVQLLEPAISFEPSVNCDIQIIGNQVTIDPYDDFELAQNYQGMIIQGFQQASGMSLGSVLKESYSFFTFIGERLVTEAPSTLQANNPVLVYTGSGYGIVWEDDRDQAPDNDIYFVIVNETGEVISTPTRISSGSGDAIDPDIVWTGSEFGVAWQDKRSGSRYDIYFTRLDEYGNIVSGSEQCIAAAALNDSLAPALSWNSSDSEYAIGWNSKVGATDNVYFKRLSSDGTPVSGSERVIYDTYPGGQYLDMIWNESNQKYALTWRGDTFHRYIIFYRIDADGLEFPGEPPIRITDYPCSTSVGEYPPSIAWNGSEYGVAYNVHHQYGSCAMTYYYKVFFKRVGANSTPLPDDSAYSNPVSSLGSTHVNACSSSIVWNGSSYGIFFEAPDGSNNGIYYQQLDSLGQRIPNSTNTLILDETYSCKAPYAIWKEPYYAMVWADERPDGTSRRIYFALLDTDGNVY
jgi:hypothetical protein